MSAAGERLVSGVVNDAADIGHLAGNASWFTAPPEG